MNFFQKFGHRKNVTYCHGCGMETNNKWLCDTCNKMDRIYQDFCEQCDGDFPKSHLMYIDRPYFNGYICDSCYGRLMEVYGKDETRY
jgi:hypothetical protein